MFLNCVVTIMQWGLRLGQYCVQTQYYTMCALNLRALSMHYV